MGCFIDRRPLKFSSSMLVLSVILLNSLDVDGFNLDAFNYAVYGTREESMFGFTVAVHKQGQNRGWVLVGAPEAQSQYQGNQVRLGGVVYKCRPEGDDPCQEIPFDREGNQFFGSREMDQKSGQWFGATLSTSGNPSGGPVVACAPRYVWYSKEMNRRDPVGTCFVSDSSFEKFEEYSPCRTSNWGYHRQGSCQAGFSAAINSIGDRLFVGAPGSYYWQGQMYSIDAHARFNYTPGLLGTTYGAKGSVHQQSLEVRPAVFQTREGKQQDDDSYLGYSTIIGDFLGTGEQGLAAGMPRGAELRGKVLLFTWNLTNYKNITSNQLGSYFGYALAAADVDGDKKLDLIVGAPMHTEANTQEKYDVGRVYVFYQGGGYSSFDKSSFIDGMNSKSRFGHSVAYLGDLNLDGYDDFAVGAPYDGEDNGGAVYIYYGSANGVLEKYGQVIYAKDIISNNGIPVSTFGFSITGGLDMDGNDYPDMAVGAYLSNSAFFFRSRPVVRVESFVRFRSESKQIDIKKKNCNLPNGQQATCTTIDFCAKYSGKGIPQQIRLNVQYILDSIKSSIPRMAFLGKNSHTFNETIILQKDKEETCRPQKIYIKNEIRDKLTRLEAEVKYYLIEDDTDESYYRRVRNPQSQLKPIVDSNLPLSRKDSISIQKNCGSDDICVPNLHLNVTKNVEKYLLDSKTNLEFYVIVSNFGEDSFETTFDFAYPEDVYYIKTEIDPDMHGISCSPGANRTISCDIGNPLEANRIVKFQMIFMPKEETKGMSTAYEFDVHVNSSNPESNTTLLDNYSHITIDIWVNAELEVSGRSIPQEIYLSNTTQYSKEIIEREYDIGPQVIHLYTLRNKGPSPILEAEMYILWPWQTLAGEDLLYLLDPPHVPEGVKCEIPAHVNYKKYQLAMDQQSVWERLQIDSSNYNVQDKYSSVAVESGRNITAVAGGTIATGGTSKLDQEISKSSGDASDVLEKRHNASATSTSESAQTEWTAASGQRSSTRVNYAGETVHITSEWRTTIENGQTVTKWKNVTTVTDSTGKIIKSEPSSDDGYGDQFSASSNLDRSGQNVAGEGNLSIFAKSGSERQGTSVDEHQFQQKTISGAYQQNVQGGQRPIGGTDEVNERKHYEEHAYTVGGGAREGGGQVSPTARYEEDQIIRHQDSQESYGSKTIQQGSTSGSSNSELNEAYEARRRYEERRQYEERLRLEEEQRRKLQQQQQTGQNVVVTADEERIKYEERLRKEEEERRRYQDQLRRLEETRIVEEKARQEAYELQIRQEEERRRQQSVLDEQRRRQPTEEERRRQQQRERERDEIRVRQEEERQRQIEESRRQYELEETRRIEDERRRQWSQQQSGAGSSWQQGGTRNRSAYGGRTRTGYFDAQGTYHDESNASGGRGGSGVVVNRTWTVEGTATVDDADRSRSGQSNFGQAAASGNQFRTQIIDLELPGVNAGGAGSSTGQRQEVSGGGNWVNSGQRTQGGSFSGTLEGGVSEEDRYKSEWQRNRWEDEPLPSQIHNQLERDNVPTDQPDLSRRRGKRQTPEVNPNIEDHLKCTATRCFYMKCVVGALKKGDFVSIVLRSRLNVRAVRHLSTTQPLRLSSLMVARISKLPHIGKPKIQALHTGESFTDIPSGEPELTPQVVPLWIILLSAIAGTLILLLVILLLYKCGFFKRKRPSSAPERQPLKTNGYHGD